MFSKRFFSLLVVLPCLTAPHMSFATAMQPVPVPIPAVQQPESADGYIKELRDIMVGKGYPAYQKFIITTLENRGYSVLENYFGTMQRAYEEGKIDDIELRYAFSTLEKLVDLKYEEFFDEWVKFFPKSYAAKTAWGQYHYRVAWEARGEGLSETVKDRQFSIFYRELTLAQQAFDESLKMTQKPIIGYFYLIGTNGETSSSLKNGQNIEVLLTEANKIDPQNFWVRQQYLRFLQPQWGGSFEEMNDFVTYLEAKKIDKKKSDLLRSKIYVEMGDSADYHDKDKVRSEELYRKAYQLQAPYKFLQIGQEAAMGLIRLMGEAPQNNVYDDELIPLLDELLDRSGNVEEEGYFQSIRANVYVAKAVKSGNIDDFKKAFEYFNAGAKLNDPYSLYRLASTYCEGFPRIVERDEVACKEMMIKSGNLGSAEAATVLKNKWGIAPEPAKTEKEAGITNAAKAIPPEDLPQTQKSLWWLHLLGVLL